MAEQIKIEGNILLPEGTLGKINVNNLLSLFADKIRDAVADVSEAVVLPNGEMSITLTAVPVEESMRCLPHDTKTYSEEKTLRSHFLSIKT